jgi:predicted nucleic acid-binding protein
MATLVDSNILLRTLHPAHPHQQIAERAVERLRLRNETLCLAPQNLIEFWAVATRSRDENGLGMSQERAATELTKLRRLFQLLPATSDVFETWQRIVISQQVVGKQTHDAHLVAAMQVHHVGNILTFNVGHFQRFSGVTVLNPSEV